MNPRDTSLSPTVYSGVTPGIGLSVRFDKCLMTRIHHCGATESCHCPNSPVPSFPPTTGVYCLRSFPFPERHRWSRTAHSRLRPSPSTQQRGFKFPVSFCGLTARLCLAMNRVPRSGRTTVYVPVSCRRASRLPLRLAVAKEAALNISRRFVWGKSSPSLRKCMAHSDRLT